MNKPSQHKPLDISLFFPAFNEEANIAASVEAALPVLRRVAHRYEVIIVDDGSSDRTGPIADGLARNDEHIRVIHHSPNLGYGAALWSGIQAARYEWIFFTDADLQFRLEELEYLARHVPESPVILGYRAPRRDPFMRILNAKGWNFLNRILFGLRVRDIDCAFKLFRRDLVASLPIRSRGAAFSAEMLIRLARNGISFKEVPVTHLPRKKGSPTGAKPAVIIRAFKELWKLYRSGLGSADNAYVQVGKFGAIGVLNTLVDVGSYYVLTRYAAFFGSHLVGTKFLTFMLGTICSFILNRRFTFGLRSKLSFAEVARFYASIALTVAVNVSALYVFNSLLGIHDLVAVVIATILTFIVGFMASKMWVFRKDRQPRDMPGDKPHPARNFMAKAQLNKKKIDWAEIARLSYD